MSWSFVANASMDTDVGVAIDEAAAVASPVPPASQLAAAREAALGLLTVVARPGDEVRLSLSGHYNEDCEPTPGWADCAVTVSVTQVPSKAGSE